MDAKYMLVTNAEEEVVAVYDRDRGATIPADERNPDWRDYLAWVADGNEPDPME